MGQRTYSCSLLDSWPAPGLLLLRLLPWTAFACQRSCGPHAVGTRLALDACATAAMDAIQ